MPGRRPQRVAEQIREEVSLIVSGELGDPRIGFVTITEVKLSPDLKHARIYASVLGTDEEVVKSFAALESAKGYIRHQLGIALRLRRIPELHFVHDESVRTAARIEELLKEASEQDKQDTE